MLDYLIEGKRAMKPLHITIQVESKSGKIDVRPFVHIVNNTMTILRRLEQNLGKTNESHIVWKIQNVQMKSPLQIAFVGENKTETNIVEIDPVTPYIQGIDELETKGTRPEVFDVTILNLIKKMLSYKEDGIDNITFSAPCLKAVTPSSCALGHIYILTASPLKPYWVITQIEGWLDELNAHGENPRFVIYNPLNDAKVKCNFPIEKIKDIRNLITERVRITGYTKFDEHHRPVEINVESYQRLRIQDELPQIADLHKLNINITGGIDSVSYIEELRDEENS